MKTKEFIERAESLGYTVGKNSAYVYLYKEQTTVVGIGLIHQYALNIMVPEKMTFQVFNLVTEYAQTALAEREEEKQYHLRLTSNLSFNQRHIFLNIEKDTGVCSLNTSKFTYAMKTIFTESEIAIMDITGFEKIEVVK